MRLKLLAAFVLAAAFYSCDDSTTGIGEFVADGDEIHASADSYNVATGTTLLDSVYSRTSTAYLGKYTDSEYGKFSAGFIAQINCPVNFELASTLQNIEEVTLQLVYPRYSQGYFGDSLAVMRLRVDSLDTVIDDNGKDKDLYYTSLNPSRYYNENTPPLAEKDYAALDQSASDSIKNSATGAWINIPLGKSFAQYIDAKYKENNHQNFKDANTFINNVLKGFYIHTSQGEGSILYINKINLLLKFSYTVKNSAGDKDSLIYRTASLAATKEVFTSTTFENSEKLKELTKDETQTYLKTPAGLCTEIQLPIEQMYATHGTDTLNSVSLVLTKYRDMSNSPYKMGTPSRLLLVRKNDAKAFFENNQVNDNSTSFLTSYSSTYNTYTFSYLNRLISHIFSEIRSGKPKVDGWDKILIIPVAVEATTDSNGNEQVLSISHDMKVNSAKLQKGTMDDGNIKIEVIYTHPKERK